MDSTISRVDTVGIPTQGDFERFKDPDGNELALHKRYAPYEDKAAG